MNHQYPQKLAFSCLDVSIFVLVASISPSTVNAQAINPAQIPNQQLPPPQDVQPPQPTLPSPKPLQPLPPPSELFPRTNPSIPEQPLPEKLPETIVVEKFNIIGNTVFTPEELAEVTAKFTNTPISLAEVFQARSEITNLYIKKGYITSGAYIPAQTIKSGVITIQVIEGKLEDIQITGTQRLNPNYVRSRLAIATSAPLNRERLLEALQLLQINPLIQNLSAELSAGSRPGASVLQVEIKEAKSFSIQAILDNGRSPSVGSFRRQLELNEGNLLGIGDGLSLAYTNTDGSNIFDAAYTLPLNPHNGTLSFNFGTTSSKVIERPFNILDIQSASQYYELTYRQPLFQTPTQEFTLGLTASRRESEASYIAGPFPALGSDENGSTRISALRFFQEWTTRNSRQVIGLRSQFNLGVGAFNATINENVPDSRFFSWQGQAQWVRLLAPDTLLLLRANTQLASTRLLPLEQLGLGGLDNVRGYRQDFLLTDNGAVASAELQIPILRLPQINSMLKLTPFVDVGVAWNNNPRDNPDPNPNTLASVGLGLRWTQGDRFTARLDWGIPLVSVNSSPGTWQENGLYFYLLYNPF